MRFDKPYLLNQL